MFLEVRGLISQVVILRARPAERWQTNEVFKAVKARHWEAQLKIEVSSQVRRVLKIRVADSKSSEAKREEKTDVSTIRQYQKISRTTSARSEVSSAGLLSRC